MAAVATTEVDSPARRLWHQDRRDATFGTVDVWQIDYGDQQVTAHASVDQLDHIEGAIELDFTPQAGHAPTPFVRLPLGDGALDFIVDTSGGIPIIIEPAALASVGLDIPADAPRSVHLASGAAGTFETEVTFVDVTVALGESEVVTTVGVGAGFAPRADGIIGTGRRPRMAGRPGHRGLRRWLL